MLGLSPPPSTGQVFLLRFSCFKVRGDNLKGGGGGGGGQGGGGDWR